MKINRSVLEIALVLFIYLSTLYLWTLPFQKNTMPYGEVDAASHFMIGDYMAQEDKAITMLPFFMDFRYGLDNRFRPHTLWYPPPYHTNFAVIQIIGGERIAPIFLLNAILSSSIVLIIYFIIRKLFGFLPALLSSLLLMFSMRDIMVYLWGQWPERIGFFFTPLVLYAFYKYTDSFLNKKENPTYLYLTFILLAVNLFMHPNGTLHSIAALAVFTILLMLKERKLPVNLKHFSFAVIIFVLIVSIFPSQTGNVVYRMIYGGGGESTVDISRLFSWFKVPKENPGVPESYFSYSAMHGLWTLPLLLIGIIFLVARRKRADLLLLGWLISLYIMTHLDVIGKGPFVHRSLAASAHIFAPITALGLIYLFSLFRQKQVKTYVKYALVAIFIILAVSINGKQAYSQLKEAYPEISRVTPYQVEAADWMRENLPEDAMVRDIGTLMMQKTRWIRVLSNRVIVSYHPDIFETEDYNWTHIMLDYSDATLLRNYPEFQQQEQKMREFENNLTNVTLLYDKDYIKVYKLG